MTRYFAICSYDRIIDLGNHPDLNAAVLTAYTVDQYPPGGGIVTTTELRSLRDAISAHIPAQVVIDFSGGAIHRVCSQTGVSALFISADSDEVSPCASDGKRPLSGYGKDSALPTPYAWWLHSTKAGGADGASRAAHYFGELRRVLRITPRRWPPVTT